MVGQFRKIKTILPGRHFIKHLTEAVDIGLGRTWSFRGHESFRTHERLLTPQSHQPDISQLGLPVDKDDIGGLHVAVGQSMLMEMFQSLRQGSPAGDAVLHSNRIAFRLPHVAAQGTRLILHGIEAPPRRDVIAQLHHVIVKGFVLHLGTSHVQDVYQSRVIPGDGLVFQNPLEFALKSPFILKIVMPDSLHCPQRTSHPASEPHLTVGAAADLPQNLMIWDRRFRANLIVLHAFRIWPAPASAQRPPGAWQDRLEPC